MFLNIACGWILFLKSCLTDLYRLFRVFKVFRFNSYYSLISFAILNLFSIWLLSLLFHLLPSFVLNILSVPFNLSTNFCYYSFWCFIPGYSRDYNIYHSLLTYHSILSCKNWIASLCLTQDIACLGLVHGDDPERCYGEGGGRGVHVWERM